MKTISILAYNRPHYLKQCLEALAKCRGVQDYIVIVSHDGPDIMPLSQIGDLGLQAIEIAQQDNLGIDHHNKWAYDCAFKHVGSEFNIALEDDAVLTPDALELAEYCANNHRSVDYLFMSLGDPFYRKEWPKGDRIYNELHETQSIYTSAWCFSKASWEWMRGHWNGHLNTQVGWDFSLQFAMWKAKKKALYPLVSRCRNIGREGVHSYPEFFDKNVAPAFYSLDQTKPPGFEITYNIDSEPVPQWIQTELSATEDRYGHLRNK